MEHAQIYVLAHCLWLSCHGGRVEWLQLKPCGPQRQKYLHSLTLYRTSLLSPGLKDRPQNWAALSPVSSELSTYVSRPGDYITIFCHLGTLKSHWHLGQFSHLQNQPHKKSLCPYFTSLCGSSIKYIADIWMGKGADTQELQMPGWRLSWGHHREEHKWPPWKMASLLQLELRESQYLSSTACSPLYPLSSGSSFAIRKPKASSRYLPQRELGSQVLP